MVNALPDHAHARGKHAATSERIDTESHATYQNQSPRGSTKSSCRPMGCFSSKPTVDPHAVPTREVTAREQASPLTSQNVETTRPSLQGTRSRSETPQAGRVTPQERPNRDSRRERVQSAPKRVQSKMDDENVPPLPPKRHRTKSHAPS